MAKNENRLVPYYREVEEHVIGCIINKPDQLPDIIDIFDPKYFYAPEFHTLAEIVLQLFKEGIQIDPINIYHQLEKNKLELIDRTDKALEISLITSFKDYVLEKHKLFILIEKWMLREQIHIGSTLAENAAEETDPFDNNERAIADLEALDLRDKLRESFGHVVDRVFEDINKQKKNYYSCPDDSTLEIEPSQIILLAGAEGTGKTKFITYLMSHLLTNNNLSVCWDSYEMSDEQILLNLASCITKVPYNSIKSRSLSEMQKAEMSRVRNIIRNFDIEFNGDPNLQAVISNYRRFCKKRKGRQTILIIDNIGIIEVPGAKTQTEAEDTIMKKMVQLRKDTCGTIFIVHHLTKEADDKTNLPYGYRPTKNFLRGSKKLLDYSNAAWLINYPNKYPDLVAQEKARRPRYLFPDGKHFIESIWMLESVKNRENNAWIIYKHANLANNQFDTL